MSTENRVDWEAKYQQGDTPWEMAGDCDRLAALVLPDGARRALTIRYDR